MFYFIILFECYVSAKLRFSWNFIRLYNTIDVVGVLRNYYINMCLTSRRPPSMHCLLSFIFVTFLILWPLSPADSIVS